MNDNSVVTYEVLEEEYKKLMSIIEEAKKADKFCAFAQRRTSIEGFDRACMDTHTFSVIREYQGNKWPRLMYFSQINLSEPMTFTPPHNNQRAQMWLREQLDPVIAFYSSPNYRYRLFDEELIMVGNRDGMLRFLYYYNETLLTY